MLLMRQFFSIQATLLNYLSHYYTPQRMVLAGVGVDHDELVRLAEEHFVNQVREVNSLIGILITLHGMLCRSPRGIARHSAMNRQRSTLEAWSRSIRIYKVGGQYCFSLSLSTLTSTFPSFLISDVSLGPTPMPELAHIAIGLESVSHQHPDFIPFCVMNTLMGGGGSFSAGGPGEDE